MAHIGKENKGSCDVFARKEVSRLSVPCLLLS